MSFGPTTSSVRYSICKVIGIVSSTVSRWPVCSGHGQCHSQPATHVSADINHYDAKSTLESSDHKASMSKM
jgi:hypothetical protein